MKKVSVVLLVCLAAFSIMASCKKTNSSAALIGIAMPETHVQRWIKDGNSLKVEAEKLGYRAEVLWGGTEQALQNRQIENLLAHGAKILIIGNIDEGVSPMVAEAFRKNVPVIAYDRIIQDSEDYDYYITFNNFKVGVLQATSIVNELNLDAATEPKQITLFAGSPTDANAKFFFNGAMSVLNPYIENGALNVVGPYPKTASDTASFHQITTEKWQAPIARARMENILKNDARNVVLDAVLAPNDTLARAIIEACKADAKYRTKLPVVSGQDAEFDSAVSIKNGEQASTVFKDTAKLARAAILLADQILKGVVPEIPGVILASGDLKEIGNTGKKYVNAYLLDPVLVTKENLIIPVDAGFYDKEQAIQLKELP